MGKVKISKGESHSPIDKLRVAVNEALHKCLFDATPNICEHAAQSASGYLLVESMVLKICLRDGITPSQAIPLLESELSQ